jgi:hypothetical protein
MVIGIMPSSVEARSRQKRVRKQVALFWKVVSAGTRPDPTGDTYRKSQPGGLRSGGIDGQPKKNRRLPWRGDTLQLPFNDPHLDKEATTNRRRLKMKVKIFERSGEPGRLEREINDFLATLGPGAVLNTQTAIAAVRNENEQIETEYVVTIWYE